MEKRFLLLNYGISNKKIQVTQDLTYEFIQELASQKFEINNPKLQYFDNDVEDYVDLENDSIQEVAEYKLIKIKVLDGEKKESYDINTPLKALNSPLSTSSVNSVFATTTQLSHLERSAEASQLPDLFEKGRPAITTASTFSSPDSKCSIAPVCTNATTSESSYDTTPSTSGAEGCLATPGTEKRKPWPRLYRLPKGNIPRCVREKLDMGKEIGSRDRSMLLDAIYNDATQHNGGLYPTSEMYDSMVDGLLREYSYLLTMGGLPSKSAREFWKDKLIFKFGNARKRIDRDHPDVISRIRKNPCKIDQTTRNEQNIFVWGLARFLPPLPLSEDLTTQQNHIDWLKREYRKSSSDIDIDNVNLKMDLTFSLRRKKIVEDKVGVKELLETFPWLQSRQEILKEFQRLKPNTPTDELEELFNTGLAKYRGAVIKLLNGKKKPTYVTEIEETSSYLRIESQRNFADDCLAIFGIMTLLKEKAEKVVIFSGTNTNIESSIVLSVKDKILSLDNSAFSVKIEGVTVFECDNFIEAFTGLVGCIYIFNLAYPKPWEKFLTFIQNVIIGLKDEDGKLNLDKRILSVLSNINSELNNK